MVDRNTLLLEDVHLLGGTFRNFAGKEGMYNREGDRSFNIAFDPDLGEKLEKDGWNIKWLKPRDEGDPELPRLEVAVNYGGRPPKVTMVTSRGKTRLDEESVSVLDYADVVKCDVLLNPYHWNVSGNSGVKAYLINMVVTIREDELELKYADVDEMDAG